MAYKSNSLSRLTATIGGGGVRVWEYWTSDAVATILAAGYVSDAGKKGLVVGDLIKVFTGTLNTTGPDASPSTASRGTVSEFASDPRVSWLTVSSISAGAATLVATDPPTINYGTSTSAAGAVTLNARAGVITTETITTTGQSVYTLTITNSQVTAGDLVLGTIQNGSNTTGIATLMSVVPSAGVLTVKIGNAATTATNAFAGSLKFSFVNLGPGTT